ncbi:MAG TPA: beta-glucosidase BglX [Cyclobacteriaceae bacterium]|nr:beta-glucosidase BglX [Cyclobacteriaceae bacterium]HMV09599.1 beta-glucosidase BglX [Cyclobacteriaceae bacterium]HMV90599.1 beta-glucosidase BglX [Cyclobacteriaceae bacterium]HMX01069.1 beta-glucosidase BglX [Cyclobacteriaceae bacterium]HMX51760.1 beta-glucosidase BglX [Cyclobacteriaceae bacterium]
MKTLRNTVFLALLTFVLACSQLPYVQPDRYESTQDKRSAKDPYAAKVDSLLSLMTLQEKIGQLNLPGANDFVTGQAKNTDIAKKIEQGQVGGLFNIKSVAKIKEVQRIAVEKSRLKIPLIFGMDVIHGYETVFPIPLGLSCTWDMNLIERSARIAAQEASADGICWTFSPMVDIARDARWGRIAEGSGEDPYLGSMIAQAMVRGYQGKDFSSNSSIMACVKHYALYGAAEAGRDYNTTDMSRVRMYNEYLPPYKAAVEAGAGSMMASFNEIDGVPATANHWLLTEVLRDQWGFNGFVVSDYTGILEMIDHGYGEDLKDVSAKALKAGLDMDMVAEGFLKTLEESLKEGRITEADINIACGRILKAKFELGLFANPYKYCDEARAKAEVFTADNRKEARSIAAQSFVLLKNDKNILPLKKSGTIALVGPLADAKENMPGTWSVAAKFDQAISLRAGLEKALGGSAKIVYAKGANIDEDSIFEQHATMFGKAAGRDKRSAAAIRDEALRIARGADVIVAALGEASEMSGESSSRSNIEIPATQKDLLKALVATGKPVVLVLFTGRPLAIKWESENVPAILNVWFGGSEAGDAIADVLFGDVNPSGKLTTTFPQSVGQLPMYYGQKSTGRPLQGQWFQKFRSNYLDVSNEPVYPFGYGLSYTSFSYSDITLDKTEVTEKDELKVSVDVTNTGSRDGSEVVQLYIHDLVGSVTRPVKELKAFEKVSLKAGEKKTITFTLTTKDLSFYKGDLSFGYEPGKFHVFVGGNSHDVKQAEFVVK